MPYRPPSELNINISGINLWIESNFRLAVIVTAFAEYATAPFYPGCDPPELLKKFLAITAIFFIMIMNGWSVKLSARVQILFTVVKLALVFSIIVGGFVQVCLL